MTNLKESMIDSITIVYLAVMRGMAYALEAAKPNNREFAVCCKVLRSKAFAEAARKVFADQGWWLLTPVIRPQDIRNIRKLREEFQEMVCDEFFSGNTVATEKNTLETALQAVIRETLDQSLRGAFVKPQGRHIH